MSSLQKGSIHISCFAFLNNPREDFNCCHAVIFDSVLYLTPLSGRRPLVNATLTYKNCGQHRNIPVGAYKISFKVSGAGNPYNKDLTQLLSIDRSIDSV